MKARFLVTDYRYCFIFVLSIVIVYGSVSDGHAQRYYPDAFGNTWTLRSTDGIDERVVTIEGPETIGTESVKVISDETNGNTSKFFVKAKSGQLLIFRATVPIRGVEAPINFSPPGTFLPVPIGLGSEWTATGEAKLFGLSVKATYAAKVVAIEEVKVPAGTFQDCLKIEQHFSSSGLIKISQQSTIWLAPDVGLVQIRNSDNVKFELIHYEIAIDGIVVAVQPKSKLATTWGALKKR